MNVVQGLFLLKQAQTVLIIAHRPLAGALRLKGRGRRNSHMAINKKVKSFFIKKKAI